MKNGAMAAFLFLMITCIAVNASAFDFSADMISSGPEGTVSGKIFSSKNKVRMEMAGTIAITRMDKNVAWMLMPSESMYIEQPIDMRNVVATEDKMPGEIERTFLGDEGIDGKNAKKYRIVYESGGNKETVLQWIDQETSIPVRTQAENGGWIVEYKNLNTGAQPDSLFEVPAGYNKMSMDIPAMAGMSLDQ